MGILRVLTTHVPADSFTASSTQYRPVHTQHTNTTQFPLIYHIKELGNKLAKPIAIRLPVGHWSDIIHVQAVLHPLQAPYNL